MLTCSRYVLWEAEDQGLELPYACRMGCCTACAVKVVEGELYQPQVRYLNGSSTWGGHAHTIVLITGPHRRLALVRSSSSRGMRSCALGFQEAIACCRRWRRTRCTTCRCERLCVGVQAATILFAYSLGAFSSSMRPTPMRPASSAMILRWSLPTWMSDTG